MDHRGHPARPGDPARYPAPPGPPPDPQARPVKSATLTGFVDLYILAFIHLRTRRVIVSGPTPNPDAKWTTQPARNASGTMADGGLPASRLLLDHGTTFTGSFDAVFAADGRGGKRAGSVAPNLNTYTERFVAAVRAECLERFLVCGEKHLRHTLKEFVAHYQEDRHIRAWEVCRWRAAGAPVPDG